MRRGWKGEDEEDDEGDKEGRRRWKVEWRKREGGKEEQEKGERGLGC